MSKTVIRSNERSKAIDMIKLISGICEKNDLMIKTAGGEKTVSSNGHSMFPDIILYGDKAQTVILQGWELKMPDTPIEDQTNIENAKTKAVLLNLNSFMIWNFSYGVLYVRERNTTSFAAVKTWASGKDTQHTISSREDVDRYQDEWEKLLQTIIIEINSYFVKGEFVSAPLGEVIAETALSATIKKHKRIVADKLNEQAVKRSDMEAFLDDWWCDLENEYQNDENDKYSAYAKYIILNWCNRIIFAHLIKRYQNKAFIIDSLDYSMSPADANQMFRTITDQCDFFNIFSEPKYSEVLHPLAWKDIISFSLFLKAHCFDKLEQTTLQSILEKTISTSKREINGQYATPYELAKILLQLTIADWEGNLLDCCCGTGTIPKAAIEIKREKKIALEAIMESVWACDKFNYPLQAANISMVSSDTVNLVNRLFKHNALTLAAGEAITFTDPANGSKIELKLPQFDSIVSNLPFVAQESLSDEDKTAIASSPMLMLDGRSDLYSYIAIKIADLLKPNGTIGIIVSNSWMGTAAGKQFFEKLNQVYHIKQIHVSGKGRWFHNADVVTSFIIAEKNNNTDPLSFWLWKKPLSYFSQDKKAERTLINSAVLNQEKDPDIAALSQYSSDEINSLMQFNISYNALFHNVSWILKLSKQIVRIDSVFDVFRGSRRGWDDLFFPAKGKHGIEPEFLKRALKNARNITELEIDADSEAFCCDLELDELQRRNKNGAYSWIKKFENQLNGKGKPLPEVLKKKGHKWYELKTTEIAEIVTTMNPDQRFFFARFKTPSFINQRLIGLNHKSSYSDLDLIHALLNSLITVFFIEASGFGRGLGVLDINKNSIAKCYMPDPKQIDDAARGKILQAFQAVKNRSINNIFDELQDPMRIQFELTVLESLHIKSYYSAIKASLLSMIQSRQSVK